MQHFELHSIRSEAVVAAGEVLARRVLDQAAAFCTHVPSAFVCAAHPTLGSLCADCVSAHLLDPDLGIEHGVCLSCGRLKRDVVQGAFATTTGLTLLLWLCEECRA